MYVCVQYGVGGFVHVRGRVGSMLMKDLDSLSSKANQPNLLLRILTLFMKYIQYMTNVYNIQVAG